MANRTLTESAARIKEIDLAIDEKKEMLTKILKEKGIETNSSETLSSLIVKVKNINNNTSSSDKNFMIAGYEFYMTVTRKLFKSIPGQPTMIKFDWGPHIDVNKIIQENNLFFTLDAFHENKIIGYIDNNNIFNIVSKNEIYILDAGALFKWIYGVTDIINLEKLNFKYASSIDDMFDDAEMITSINLPSSLKESNYIYGRMTDIFNYCLKATEIDVSNLNISNVKDIRRMFHHCESLTNIIGLNTLDTSNIEEMSYMFSYAKKITTIDVSNFNTQNVTHFDRMFYHTDSVQELDVSGWDTSNSITMHSMFNDCYKLKSINTSNFNTSKVTDMWGMFRNCNDLVTLDLTSFNTSAVVSMEEMFYGCDLIETIDISSFDTSKTTNMKNMFLDCPKLTTIWVGPNWKIPSKYNLADLGINDPNIIKQK